MKSQIILLLLPIIIYTHKYTCAFSELYAQSDHYGTQPQIQQQTYSQTARRNLLTISRSPMRISLNMDDLNTVKTTPNGEAQTTTTKLNFIKRAMSVTEHFFEKRLSLIPEAEVDIPSLCFDYSPPATDVSDNIVADLHVYVLYKTDSTIGYGATGVSCQWNPVVSSYPDTALKSRRPTVGRIIFNTHKIIDDQAALTNRLFATVTSTALHQFIHILGFDQSLYNYYMDLNTGSLHAQVTISSTLHASRTGGDNHIMVTPHVKAWAREHFGCDTLDGMALENQEGNGNARGSHWQRLSAYDELMTGTEMGTQKSITALTFQLLKDMGWYGVDGSFNDTTNYGKGKGCTFYSDACYGTDTYPKYFCNPTQFTDVTQCSSTFLGKAGCTSQAALMADGCGMFLDYWSCVDPDTPDYGYQTYTLQKYRTNSLCVKSTLSTVSITSDYRGRCYPFVCDAAATKITFTIGQYTISCFSNEQGQTKTMSSLGGYIQCPIFADFCTDSKKICPNWCSQNGFCTGGSCNCLAGSTVYSGEDCSITSCTLSQYWNPATSACVGTCPDGTYANKYSRTCMPCDSACPKCRDQPHICTGCSSSGGTTLLLVPFNNTCVQQCPSDTYRLVDNCQLCSAAAFCAQCTGSDTTCTKCINTGSPPLYFLQTPTQGSCGTTCTTGSFLIKDQVNFVCVQTCPNELKLDSANSRCITCNPDFKVIDSGDNNCVPTCPAGYYTDHQNYLCGNCDDTCQQCYDEFAQNCTKCYAPGDGAYNYLYLDMCVSVCPGGFYPNVTSGTCEKCTIQLHCYRCEITTVVKCLSCQYGYFFQLDQTCTTSCNSHYYKNTWNQSCDECHANCKDCTSAYESSCLNCDSPKYYMSNLTGGYCLDQCPTEGYVNFAGTTCQPCHETCKSCTGLTSADCVTCDDGLYLQAGKCRYVCSPGMFPDETTKICQTCNSKCTFCFGNSEENCTKCTTNYVLNNFTCSASCPQGQTPNTYKVCEMIVTASEFLNIGISICLLVISLIML